MHLGHQNLVQRTISVYRYTSICVVTKTINKPFNHISHTSHYQTECLGKVVIKDRTDHFLLAVIFRMLISTYELLPASLAEDDPGSWSPPREGRAEEHFRADLCCSN
jgi:hypothetical protein